ncbi:MAG: 30S ribosomal protein S3 [Minisyncoccia bacterium]
MTHTVHPYAHRLGIIRDWKSRWFALTKKSFRENIAADAAIRKFLEKKLRSAYLAGLEIERTATEVRVIVHTARPGLVIGRSGENAGKLRKELADVIRTVSKETKREVKLDIMEVRQPETNAAVVGYMIAEGLEKRLPFRRVLKSTVEKVMAVREVIGVRIVVSGRLGGADMSRTEKIMKGRVPLQTFRANIDYAHTEAHLPYGQIGVKVWIYLGDSFSKKEMSAPAPEASRTRTGGRSR